MKKNKAEGIFSDTPDPEHIKWLNFIIEKTGAKVVISSVWRKSQSFIDICRLLTIQGFKGEIIGQTPEFDSYRGTEIQAWLNIHKDQLTKYKDNMWFQHNEPVESFVIIDDDADMGDLLPYLVMTNNKEGLTEADALKAIKVLTKGVL